MGNIHISKENEVYTMKVTIRGLIGATSRILQRRTNYMDWEQFNNMMEFQSTFCWQQQVRKENLEAKK